jgi:trigger factor
MKIEITDVSPVRKKMAVEAAPDEVAHERDVVLRRYARQVRIPGFRPGKAPLEVIRARFGREVDEDLKERLVARLYGEAIREKGLHPLGDPVLEDVSLEEGEPFRFRTTFEVLPEFTPKSHHGIEVRKPAVRVTDQDVGSALEEVRQAHTRFVTEEGRAAATGDVLVVDLEGRPEGGEPFHRERVLMEVGASTNLPEFNDNLEGATAGSTREFTVRYPEKYEAENLAGRTVAYTVVIHEVKRREVPELDDEFAKDIGDFQSLDALRGKIREDLTARKRAEAEQAVRQATLDKVLLENPIALPDVLVQEEIRHRLEDIARMMVQQGVDPRNADVDWKALREKQENGARRTVHARLVLDAIARTEGLAVDDAALEERLRADAEKIGEAYVKLRARLEKQGALEALRNQILREKSLDFLTSVANIQVEE